MMKRHDCKLQINFKGALGDVLCLSSAVHDLLLENPDAKISVNTPFVEVFRFYRLSGICKESGQVTITWDHYRQAVEQAKESPQHVTEFFHDVLANLTGLPCSKRTLRPVIHSAANERVNPFAENKYWVVFAGGKSDIPLKLWYGPYFQQVADYLHSCGRLVVQTGRSKDRHYHLRQSIKIFDDNYKPSNIRRLFQIIKYAEGVICPITSGMHIAAAFDKPCVVIGGGREDPWWEAYNSDYGAFGGHYSGVPHKYLNTVGTDMPCCRLSGCWNRQFQNIETEGCDNFAKTVEFPGQIAHCMLAIDPSSVIAAIDSYIR